MPMGDAPEPSKIIPLRRDEFQIVDQPAEDWGTPDGYGGWSAAFDAETERIERLIRGSGGRTRSRSPEEGEHERFQPNGETGYYPNGPDTAWGDLYEPSSGYVRHTKTPWLKVSASVAGAVVTGVLLGFFVLSWFDGRTEPAPSPSTQAGENAAAVTGKEPAAGKDVAAGAKTADPQASAGAGAQQAAGTSASGGTAAAASIPARTYSVLQNGGFASAQGAETAQAELKKKGYASATEQAEKHYVYAGVFTNRDEATALGKQLQAKNVEIYVKTYSLPALSQVAWTGKTEGLQTYLAQSDSLVQMISGITAVHLEEAKPTPIGDGTVASLKTSHEAWTASANAVAQAAPEGAKPLVQQMNAAMNTAKKSVDEYKKNPSAAMMWEAQNGLIQFVVAERALLQKLGGTQ